MDLCCARETAGRRFTGDLRSPGKSGCVPSAGRSPRSGRRQGFVLVMVLILLTVAALSLAGLARRSLQIAADAADAQAEFERKWQTATLQQALLANADAILRSHHAASLDTAAEDGEAVWPETALVEGRIDAGRYEYHFVLADEDAKVNLNQVLRQDRDALRTVVMQLRPASTSHALIPVPVESLPRDKRGRYVLQSWGQVFVPAESGFGKSGGRLIRDATRQLTCWGSGRLNIVRATDESIQVLCGLLLSPRVVDRLLKTRADGGVASLEDLIGRMELKAEERFIFQRLLTDRTNCFTLWLTISNGRREWTKLVVSQSDRGNPAMFQSFTW